MSESDADRIARLTREARDKREAEEARIAEQLRRELESGAP